MRKMWKVVLIGLGLFLAVSYGVYAVAYQGNYNVTVSGSGVRSTLGVITISGVEVESDPCGLWDYLDVLKGHSVNPALYNYTLYAELERSDETYTGVCDLTLTAESSDWSVMVENVPAGTYELHITVVQSYTGATAWEQSSDVVVGP